MAPASKQADRRASKKAEQAQKEAEEAAAAAASLRGQSPSELVDVAKALAKDSVIAENALKVPDYAKDGIAIMKGEKKEAPAGEDKETTDEANKENAEASNGEGDFVVEMDACAEFNKLVDRLHWSNPLGLSKSKDEALNGWKAMKDFERLDFGPK